MILEHRGRLTACAIALAAVAAFSVSGYCEQASFGQSVANQSMSAREQPCSSLVESASAPDKLGHIVGREVHFSIENHEALLFLPDQKSQRNVIDWVWYAPMVPHEPNEHQAFIIQHVLNAGMAFAAIDVGESYGNPEGTRVYSEFHDALARCFHLSPKAVLLPQSRGGLMLFNWAALHPDEVERIAGIYPVCDLRSYPGIVTAAKAYGMTVQQMGMQLNQHNPIDLLSPLVKAGVPILFIHGDNDKVVPLPDNSEKLVHRYQELGGSANLIIVPGKGHEEIPQFFQSQQFVTFLTTGKYPAGA